MIGQKGIKEAGRSAFFTETKDLTKKRHAYMLRIFKIFRIFGSEKYNIFNILGKFEDLSTGP
jgi:hypothetical protein